MAIQQLSDGRWRVDVEPVKGKRFRKTLKTKAEAMRFEATCRAKCSESNDWAPRPKDKRRLSELVELWFDLHGVSLSDGVRRVAILRACTKAMGDPIARMVDDAPPVSVHATADQGAAVAWLYRHGRVMDRVDDEEGGVRLAVRLTAQALGQFEQRFPGADLTPL